MIYRPYTNNNAIPGNSTGPVNNSAYPQTTLMGAFVSRLPYAYQIIDAMVKSNPKFEAFKNKSSVRDDMIQSQSVFMHQDQDAGTPGSLTINKDYQAFIYANVDKDKGRRLMDYRRMAAYAELADCLDEICDECIVTDEQGRIVTLDIRGDMIREAQETLNKEFTKVIEAFNLEETGWERFRQFLIDGELYFENIIKEDQLNLGILGIVALPAEMINPVYHNVQNEIIRGFLVRKPVNGPVQSINSEDQEQLMFFQKSQVTYIHSGIWNEFKTFRLPFIENAKRAYRQLSLIEDSVVIYRLVRAPERLVFKVYTGNLPPPKAESYLKKLMQRYWSARSYNASEGRVTNVYDPQSMLDAYWFTKDAQGNGTDVTTLPSGNSLGEIKDLDYFLTKLYKSLKVPISRFLAPGDPFKDGAEITRDELRFARFIMRLQSQFAQGIKQAFITHLKLKGLWKQYKLREQDLVIKFNEPTSFMAMRSQQLQNLRFEAYNIATQTDAVSKSFAQKYYLDWTVKQMEENREWLRKDAALVWEIQNIQQNGPNFREMIGQQVEGGGAEAMGGIGGGAGGMPDLGPMPPGAEEIPPFGPGGPEAPEGGAPVEQPPGGAAVPPPPV